jgi:hypothetical protein
VEYNGSQKEHMERYIHSGHDFSGDPGILAPRKSLQELPQLTFQCKFLSNVLSIIINSC